MILFLNKSDIFREKIADKDLTVCFPEYTGGRNFDAAVKFVEKKFREQCDGRDQDIYTHVTCATDTTNVQKVFDNVREIVIKESMKRSGL